MKISRPLLAALALVPLLPLPLLAADDNTVAIKAAKDHIDFLVGTDLVGRYHIGKNVAKPYFWPLNGPGGTPIARGWPMVEAKKGESIDHPHQKSLWFCHGDIIPEGIEIKHKIRGIEGIDFWSEAKGHGKIVCTGVLPRGLEPARGSHDAVTTTNEWQTADGLKILDEERTLHLYSFGKTRLLIFDIDLHASVTALTFGDTKEGSMGLRVNDAIRENKGNGKLVNAEGLIDMNKCWGRMSAWCDYSGTIDGKKVGIAIFDHPANKPAACWHSRDYGLMAANPFGREKSGFPALKGNTNLFKLARGRHLKLRYGVLIHPGDVKEGNVSEYFEKFTKIKK
jgi:hypothetical protein